jgi:hypothetical protein
MLKTAYGARPANKRYRPAIKTLLVMKLTIILLTVCCLHVSARGLAQSVTFSGKEVPLESVLTTVKKQTGFVFLYTESVIRSA